MVSGTLIKGVLFLQWRFLVSLISVAGHRKDPERPTNRTNLEIRAAAKSATRSSQETEARQQAQSEHTLRGVLTHERA